MTIDSTGNVGIGTTSPISKLHVEGACVTGDTLLRRRRKKSKVKSQKSKVTGGWDPNNDFENVRIDQIEEGDEVLSFDEALGGLKFARINKLMDMGVHEVYEVVTKSGRKIRTTDNHPYLTLIENERLS